MKKYKGREDKGIKKWKKNDTSLSHNGELAENYHCWPLVTVICLITKAETEQNNIVQ